MATRKTLSERFHASLTSEGHTVTKKDAESMTELFFRVLGESIQEDRKVSCRGFGTFELKERKERNGRNPKTGESLVVPAHDVLKFKPSPALKQAVAE
jgi:nucleoid DNA-binding protein